MTDAARDARAALDAYFTAWNAADEEGMRQAFNYPFITLGPAGMVITVQTAEEFTHDFDRLREREGWHHSTLDACEVLSVSADKVYFRVDFSRYKADGTKYAGGATQYIITNKEGHWGMQFRSGMPRG